MFTKAALVAVCLLGLVGCASTPVEAARDCNAPPQFATARVILIGEVHGTQETPAFVGRAACALAAKDELIVGLEISGSEQPRINAYLSSKGSRKDRVALLSGPFWKFQDGRSSVAMVELIDRLRRLSLRGAKVHAVALDTSEGKSSKDAAMANSIRHALTARPKAKMLALMGNYHARETKSGNTNDPPAGSLLRDISPLVVFAGYSAGIAWICEGHGKCGASTISSRWGRERQPGYYPGESPLEGYDDSVHLGTVSASPPMRDEAP